MSTFVNLMLLRLAGMRVYVSLELPKALIIWLPLVFLLSEQVPWSCDEDPQAQLLPGGSGRPHTWMSLDLIFPVFPSAGVFPATIPKAPSFPGVCPGSIPRIHRAGNASVGTDLLKLWPVLKRRTPPRGQ